MAGSCIARCRLAPRVGNGEVSGDGNSIATRVGKAIAELRQIGSGSATRFLTSVVLCGLTATCYTCTRRERLSTAGFPYSHKHFSPTATGISGLPAGCRRRKKAQAKACELSKINDLTIRKG
jgi:hypothetical protein